MSGAAIRAGGGAPSAQTPPPRAPSTSANLRSRTANQPSTSANLPSPSANLPSQTANLPSPSPNLPSTSANLPSPSADLPSPSADLPSPSADLPSPDKPGGAGARGAGPARLDFGAGRRPRRPSLTPLVDVVFLLLVFFMLAARFGPEQALPLATRGGVGDWEGPPRLVTVGAADLRLNGAPVTLAALPEALRRLSPRPGAPVVLRAGDGADVEAVARVLGRLAAEGMTDVVLLP